MFNETGEHLARELKPFLYPDPSDSEVLAPLQLILQFGFFYRFEAKGLEWQLTVFSEPCMCWFWGAFLMSTGTRWCLRYCTSCLMPWSTTILLSGYEVLFCMAVFVSLMPKSSILVIKSSISIWPLNSVPILKVNGWPANCKFLSLEIFDSWDFLLATVPNNFLVIWF